MRPRILLAALTVAAALAAVACVSDEPSSGGGDAPISATPDTSPQPAGVNPLHSARLDLADRLATEADQVALSELRHAGWDGCFGIRLPNSVCTEQFVGGVIAYFEADDERYRYHLVGDAFIPASFIDGATLDDGSEVPGELQSDLVSLSAGYARGDLALRLDIDADEVALEAIAPVTFSDGCLGFLPDGQDVCDSAIYQGGIILLGHAGEQYRYHVAEAGRIVPVSFLDGELTVEPDPAVVAVQREMREDLAGRLGADIDAVSVSAFREVTWPDGCLGVRRPNGLCTQALVDGFLALLVGSDGKVYRYHGSGSEFIATDFEPGITVDEPLPRDAG